MVLKRIILIILGLLLLAGTVTASIDLTPSVIYSSNTGWLVANGASQSTITVIASSPSGPLTGANVAFNVMNPAMGTISNTSPGVTTGSGGTAIGVFTVGTISGIAVIDATITYPNGDGTYSSTTLNCSQNIDHDTAKFATFTYSPQVPVGSVTPLNITLTDNWGNPINNINPADNTTVTLSMSGTGSSGFSSGSGYVNQISVPPDAFGNVSVSVLVSSLVGSNPITMSPLGLIGIQLIDIEGVSATPAFMSETIIPVSQSSCSSSTSCPADGNHPFNLYYTVLDQYQNPVSGATVWINATQNGVITASVPVVTDSSGVAYQQYTQATAGTYTLTAQAAGNSSILCTSTNTVGYCSQNVQYYAINPVNMQLIVSPQMLVSRDVLATSSASLMARVMDAYGNPVETFQGAPENVTFILNSPDSFPGAPSGGYTETRNSSLSANNANMADNGFATVQFYPGAFATSGQTGYNATATGQVSVTALWISPQGSQVTSTVPLVWKNYPYLSITSNASTTNAVVGSNITITIQVNGDGAALQPKPIDVELCIDRSGSMLEGYPNDKMMASQAAAANFAYNLTVGRDRIGIVSFADDSATSGWANLSPTAGYTYNSKTKTYNLSSWNWNNVYGYSSQHLIGSDSNPVNPWAWVAEPANGQNANVGQFNCGSNCPGTSATGYDTTALHWQILSANFNNGNPKYYGNGVYNSTDLAFGYYQGQTSVKNALATIVPAGGTPMRYGLWSAVSQLIANPPSNSGTVRAVILQTDGDWNTGGDPEGGSGAASLSGVGTGSVLSWAYANGIKVFTIGLGSDVNANELQLYASQTNGTYYYASSGSALNGIYNAIAGQLNQQAGGNTTMVANFGTISVNNSTVSNVGAYLNYLYIPMVSTYVDMFNTTPAGATYTYPGYPYTQNDTYNWTHYQNLTFNIGTMKLNDTWMTSISFTLLQNGTITLFGPNSGSSVSFTDASTNTTTTAFIPQLLINVRNGTVIAGLNGPTLTVDNLSRIDSGSDLNLVTLQWNTTYTGPSASGTVGEWAYYRSTSASQWTTSSTTIPPIPGPTTGYPGVLTTANIDTSTWAPGSYILEIYAQANNAPDSFATISYTKSSTSGGAYIKLE
jgi:hypothetical protein